MFIEIRHLQTLQALIQHGNLVQAAEALHLTQSALSHQIRNIEKHFDVPLVNRKSRPLRLTHAGEELLKLADSILPQVQRAERYLKNLKSGQSGRLNIAIECHSCFDWLMPTMNTYRKNWPDIEMDLSLAMQFDPLTALLNGEVDLAITSDPKHGEQIYYFPLFEYQMLLHINPGSTLANKPWIEPKDLSEQTLITYPVSPLRLDIFTRFLTPARIQPKAIRQTELTQMMLQLVASQKGVCALPSWASDKQQQELLTKPLGENGLWCTLYIAVLNEQKQTAYIESFVEQAKAICLQTLPEIRELV